MKYTFEYILNALEKTNLSIENEFYMEMAEEFAESLDDNFFDGKFICDNGATKLVIIPEDDSIDFVIKIPFSGYMNEDWENDKEVYCDFYNSGNVMGNWDYCATEVQRYAEAKQLGFANYLAETKLIGYVRGYPIYIQAKCHTMTDTLSSHIHSNDENSATLKKINSYYITNLNWLTDFRLCYGETALHDFLKFISNHKWDDDLRNDNIGYCKDKPVLIDYSGYAEEDYSDDCYGYENSNSFSA